MHHISRFQMTRLVLATASLAACNVDTPVGIATAPRTSTEPSFAASSGKTPKIAFAAGQPGQMAIYTMRPDGTGRTAITSGYDDVTPPWSPDGTRIVFDRVYAGNKDIWVMGADGSNPQRLTTHITVDDDPTWSPDGTKIAFRSVRFGTSEVFVMNADGSSQTRVTYCD